MIVKFTWSEAKNATNKRKHGISFQEAKALFTSGVDYLEIFDEDHSDEEDRFLAIGPIARGLVLVVWTERESGHSPHHRSQLGKARRAGTLSRVHGVTLMTDIPELTPQQFARAIPARTRKRILLGQIESGDDIAALRRFVGLTQARFAAAMGISVHTLRNWEQGRRAPEGPALALLKIAARHPRILRENLRRAA